MGCLWEKGFYWLVGFFFKVQPNKPESRLLPLLGDSREPALYSDALPVRGIAA
jgi:hypothetical protein